MKCHDFMRLNHSIKRFYQDASRAERAAAVLHRRRCRHCMAFMKAMRRKTIITPEEAMLAQATMEADRKDPEYMAVVGF